MRRAARQLLSGSQGSAFLATRRHIAILEQYHSMRLFGQSRAKVRLSDTVSHFRNAVADGLTIRVQESLNDLRWTPATIWYEVIGQKRARAGRHGERKRPA